MSTPKEILKRFWGYDSFRPYQEEIIHSVLSKKNTLAILPTGGGKSVCFQVPALINEGICIVITPLIALMKDQVDLLKSKGIKAYAIYSGMTRREIDVILDNCIYGNAKFLYVSPERLETELFLARSSQMKVNLLAIDEAHCISQWGYDFRPSYLKIVDFRKHLGDVNCIALTATATSEVQEDILLQLGIENAHKFQASFLREKLSFSIRQTENKESKLLEILEKVRGSAIIYVSSRKVTKELSIWLNHNNISADFYHAGLSHDSRQRKQEEWQMNIVRVMVCTNAFGMGINKSDVRTVVHYDIPTSLEAYYQEAGRAGRDGKIAFAVILSNESDKIALKNNLERSHPSIDFIRKIYQSLANYLKIAVGSSAMESYDFDIHGFCDNFNFHNGEVYAALKRLEEEGFVSLNEGFYHPSKFIFNVKKEKVYEYQVIHEDYEQLIKGLMRMYGGETFVQFTPLSERQLARYLNTSTYQVIKKLEALHKNGIIFYDKVKDKPQLTFLTQRYDAAKLPLNYERLHERKKVDSAKLSSIIKYVENDIDCRMRVICSYFGETLGEECGKCDICLQKKKGSDDRPAVRDIKENILLTLKDNSLTEKELLKEVKSHHHTYFLDAIKKMLDNKELYYDQSGKLHLTKKGDH